MRNNFKIKIKNLHLYKKNESVLIIDSFFARNYLVLHQGCQVGRLVSRRSTHVQD